jgi:hypothetical protein
MADKASFPGEIILLCPKSNSKAAVGVPPVYTRPKKAHRKGVDDVVQPLQGDWSRVIGLLHKRPTVAVEEEAVLAVDVAPGHGTELVLGWMLIPGVVPPGAGVGRGDESSRLRVRVEAKSGEKYALLRARAHWGMVLVKPGARIAVSSTHSHETDSTRKHAGLGRK